MRLTSTGLGIGTSSPAGKLHVVGAQNAWSQVIAGNTTSAQSYGMRIQAGTTSADTSLLIRDATNTADYLTVIGNGNVGIGTSSPSSKLSVSGAVRRYYVTGGNPQAEEGFTYSDVTTAYAGMWFNNYFSSTLKTDILFKTSNDAGTVATVATLNGAGNLGLGVTPSAWVSAGKIIQFGNGSPSIGTQNTGDANFMHNAYESPASTFKYIQSGSGALRYQLDINNNVHKWYTAPSGTAGDAISFTQAMTLDASGRLGIGTSSPASYARLSVSGTAGDQTAANQQLVISAPTTTAGQGAGIRLNAASGAKEAVSIIGVVNEASGNAGAMTFHVYDLGPIIPERMRIDSAGNLGLGVTPSAWLPLGSGGPILQIQNAAFFGSASTTGVLNNAYYNGGFKYISSDYASWYEQIDSKHVWYTAPSGTAGNAISFTQAMTLTAAGNLGIGTSSPTSPLTISKSNATAIAISSGASYPVNA
jgi:hypothetical protein